MKKLLIVIAIFCVGTLKAENKQMVLDSLKSCLVITGNDTNRVNLLNEISGNLIDQGDYELALQYALKAMAFSKQLNFTTGISSAYRKIAGIDLQQGNYPSALQNFLQASKIGNENEQFYANRGIGTAYLYMNDESALNYLLKALSYKKDDIYSYSAIGNFYLQKKDYKTALDYYNKGLKYSTLNNDKNGISSMINSIGTVFEYEGQLDSSLVCYFKTLKIKEEILDYTGMVDALAGIGDVYFTQNKISESLKYESRSLELAYKIGYLISVAQTERKLQEIYEALGNKSKAYEHFKKFILAKDSITNDATTKRMVRTEMNFRFEKEKELAKADQDKKDAIKKAELRNQRNQRNIFLGCFMIVVFFSIFLFRLFKRTQRQKRLIEKQKLLVEEKKKEIEEQKKELTDNIFYSKRIQDAVLPPISQIKESLPNSFVLNLPKDIVSGDFYFFEKTEDKIIFAVADCTSHSVSGCLMSLLCSNLLNEALSKGISIPSKILDYVNIALARTLHQTNQEDNYETTVKDGMDISLCCYDSKTKVLEFSGAYNPALILRDNQFIEISADKLQMGQAKELYTNHQMQLEQDDIIYLSSDGISDQFGGEKGKKLKYKNFLALLNKISVYGNMEEQRNNLSQSFNEWKGELSQTDDVLVMGIKI